MTPERAAEVLRALLGSLDIWIGELEALDDCCPGKVSHLLGQVRQTRVSLAQLLARDEAPQG